MTKQKIHLKLKNKPLCGIHKLRYSEDVTCGNCKRAIEK
jgi:hypothetical protein